MCHKNQAILPKQWPYNLWRLISAASESMILFLNSAVVWKNNPKKAFFSTLAKNFPPDKVPPHTHTHPGNQDAALKEMSDIRKKYRKKIPIFRETSRIYWIRVCFRSRMEFFCTKIVWHSWTYLFLFFGHSEEITFL